MISATFLTKSLPEEGGFTWMKAKTLHCPPLFYYITIINETPPAQEVRSGKKATEILFRKPNQIIKS